MLNNTFVKGSARKLQWSGRVKGVTSNLGEEIFNIRGGKKFSSKGGGGGPKNQKQVLRIGTLKRKGKKDTDPIDASSGKLGETKLPRMEGKGLLF